ncbi:MAG: C4-type zinc ribbon domain-containing protein [Nitrospira sp.]|nr:C4-type zinc ribbon domain-containing protein [Nitrospira sp.]
MSHKLSPLLELQKLDLRIMGITDIRRKIPERLAAAEAPLREASKILSDAKAAVEAVVKERRAHEKDLEMHEAQTEKMKSHAASLKTNKEYQAHLFEVELANKKRGDFEEKILICMEQVDQLQQAVAKTQSQVKNLDATFAQEKNELNEQERTLAAELADVEAAYHEAAAKVEKSLLERYNQIKASRKDQALAAVSGGLCLGCRLQIPPQLIAQVKRSDDLHVCPYCRRMLYWEGEPPTETSSALSEARKSDMEMGESV